jgi:hypothetical protein
MLLTVLKLICSAFTSAESQVEAPIDKVWWDGLSEDWKNIFLINQNLSTQGVDIFKLQQAYSNRLNLPGEEEYSVLNSSLHDLHEGKIFKLGYVDLYRLALRKKLITTNDSIDLTTLPDLDTLYMVNGPGDLTPLRKFSHLKVLIINDCGVDHNIPVSQQLLNLEPLRHLRELKVLQCVSPALKSLSPIRDLMSLQELYCDNSHVLSLAPLVGLTSLRIFSLGSNVKDVNVIAQLTNLRELYITSGKQVPDLTKLRQLKKLCITESELALTNASYRTTSIQFLSNLTSLEYLDLNATSYKGDLTPLSGLQNLKAITLPPVSNAQMLVFKEAHPDCIIINGFQFER